MLLYSDISSGGLFDCLLEADRVASEKRPSRGEVVLDKHRQHPKPQE